MSGQNYYQFQTTVFLLSFLSPSFVVVFRPRSSQYKHIKNGKSRARRTCVLINAGGPIIIKNEQLSSIESLIRDTAEPNNNFNNYNCALAIYYLNICCPYKMRPLLQDARINKLLILYLLQTKGTQSFGKRHIKTHILCRRCGKRSFHAQKKTCAACGAPSAKIRKCKC